MKYQFCYYASNGLFHTSKPHKDPDRIRWQAKRIAARFKLVVYVQSAHKGELRPVAVYS